MSQIKVEFFHVASLQLAANLLAVLNREKTTADEFMCLYAHISKVKTVKEIKNYLLINYSNVMAYANEIDKLISLYNYK